MSNNIGSTTATCCTPNGAGAGRVRYFARQLITADDLTQEQEYFRAKMRRHNRMLHGWGVVCGCAVTATTKDNTVCIQPGYALSPQGDEIVVDRCLSVDLSQQGLDGNATSVCGDDVDPWCATVRVDLRPNSVVYLAIAYGEQPSRPVRVQSSGCGCDSSACEYSRIREGYVVRLLTSLPDVYLQPAPSPSAIFGCDDGLHDCPQCVDDPWVVLARITIGGKQIADANIDNVQYRRNVASFGDWWFTCQDDEPNVAATVQPATGTASGVGFGHPALGQPAGRATEFFGRTADVGVQRVNSGPMQGRIVRLRGAAQPGVMDLPVERLNALAAFDPGASARTSDAPVRVDAVRVLDAAAPDAAATELASAASAGQTVRASGAPNAIEVHFANAPLAFDSVDTNTFKVAAADGTSLPGKVLLMPNNSARLALDAPLKPGDYTVTLVGAPPQANGAAITSHQGVALQGDGQAPSDFSFKLHVSQDGGQ